MARGRRWPTVGGPVDEAPVAASTVLDVGEAARRPPSGKPLVRVLQMLEGDRYSQLAETTVELAVSKEQTDVVPPPSEDVRDRLALRDEGAEPDAVARVLDVEPEAVGPLLTLAEAKLAGIMATQ
jgi:hypothetical protein